MAWQTIELNSLQGKLAGAEVTALQNAALASGQSDPIPDTINRVVDEVRGYIAAGGFALEHGSKVPSKLVDATLTLISWRAALRLNVKILLGDSRRAEYDQALRLLGRVADGKFMIEEPEIGDSEIIGFPKPSFGKRPHNYKREDEDGI